MVGLRHTSQLTRPRFLNLSSLVELVPHIPLVLDQWRELGILHQGRLDLGVLGWAQMWPIRLVEMRGGE